MFRQIVAESIVLSLAGALVSLLVVAGVFMAVRTLAPDLPRQDELGGDTRTFLYALAVAVLVAIISGSFPALRAIHRPQSLSQWGRGQVSSRHSLQWSLVSIQVALSVMLLVGAGLLLRSFDALSRVDEGFDPSNVLTFRVSASYGEPGGYDGIVQRINNTLDELAALPGVEATATSLMLPGIAARNETDFQIVDGPADPERPVTAELRIVSPDYFKAVSIPLLAGEVCRRPPDSQGTVQDVMVNRSLAERYFPTGSPVGVRVSAMPFLPSGRITGVVGDAREFGVDREPVPTVYTCFSAPIATPWFLVRTRNDTAAALRTIRARLAEIEPLRAVYDITTLEQRISGAYAQNRLRTVLLVLFSATALALTCLGVYGTLSYMVGLRRREVGLRMALGAMSRNIVRHFLFKALRVVGLACALGLALSLAFTRVLSGMLYGVSPSDPATLSAVIVLVLLVSAFAALFPALRASRDEPMSALRQD